MHSLPPVYPRIKHVGFLESMRPMLEQVEARGGDREAHAPVAYPLADGSDLLVTFAVDTPAQFVTLTGEGMVETGLDPQSMYELAIDNMLLLVAPNVGTRDFGLYKALVAGDGFEACMLLLPDLWEQLAQEFEGELIAVVPSRDAVYFMDSGASFEKRGEIVSATEALGRMCRAAMGVRAEAGPHGLSDKVMALTPDGWCVRGTLKDYCEPALEA
ncbi:MULTISPECIES: hypothetical protein [unclassified Variovorax]|jgi:hypothetical protein|uniref:hypothetical protein n=1 Tax=unclassified Variovorax TaxID=663243 RepID=UPI000F7F9859|nr:MULTISPECIES: hypothetical protein [unclassified Variovorax]RSZ32652.1 hypothetical protein EJO70_29270 [Variovorax sp. 553]RSZ33112.1 hypothetical protein EJO71_29815 [Variovorax sp. 679]